MPSGQFSTDSLSRFTSEALEAELYDPETSSHDGDDFPVPNPPRASVPTPAESQEDQSPQDLGEGTGEAEAVTETQPEQEAGGAELEQAADGDLGGDAEPPEAPAVETDDEQPDFFDSEPPAVQEEQAEEPADFFEGRGVGLEIPDIPDLGAATASLDGNTRLAPSVQRDAGDPAANRSSENEAVRETELPDMDVGFGNGSGGGDSAGGVSYEALREMTQQTLAPHFEEVGRTLNGIVRDEMTIHTELLKLGRSF